MGCGLKQGTVGLAAREGRQHARRGAATTCRPAWEGWPTARTEWGHVLESTRLMGTERGQEEGLGQEPGRDPPTGDTGW